MIVNHRFFHPDHCERASTFMNGMIPTLSDISGDSDLNANHDEISATPDDGDSERPIAVWPELTEFGQEILSVLNGLYGIDTEDASLASARA